MSLEPRRLSLFLRGLQSTYSSLCTGPELDRLLDSAAARFSNSSDDDRLGSSVDFTELLFEVLHRQFLRAQTTQDTAQRSADLETLSIVWPLLSVLVIDTGP